MSPQPTKSRISSGKLKRNTSREHPTDKKPGRVSTGTVFVWARAPWGTAWRTKSSILTALHSRCLLCTGPFPAAGELRLAQSDRGK